MPVRIPGPTICGAWPKIFVQTRSQIGTTGGTTLERIACVTSRG